MRSVRRSTGGALAVVLVALVACAETRTAPTTPSPAPEATPTSVANVDPPSDPPHPGDADHDGIPDANDKCPNAPETYNGIDDEDGCPDKAVCSPGVPTPIVILEKLRFAKGSSAIGPDATELLHSVAEVMTAHPEFHLLEVEGFADDEGTPAAALALSTARAKAALDQLVAHGVGKERLRAKGYGPYCRLDGAAPEQNRRVEFRFAAVDPSAAIPNELGCAEATAHGIVPDPVP